MAQRRRSFSVEFREKAVGYVVEQNKSIAAAARELGVGESTLADWASTHRQRESGRDDRVINDESVELRRLRAENRELQMRVELLKKGSPPVAVGE